jgi:SpoVK/Ycf46/Vps4 family AAA+-type ATPase
MATADQVLALIRAHADHDDKRFRAVTRQIQAHAARKNQHSIAERIARASDRSFVRLESASLDGAILTHTSFVRLDDMVLGDEPRARLDRIVLEHRKAADLRNAGLEPKSKVLLSGPPGCGKTMASWALAAELELPLRFVNRSKVVQSFVGGTAKRLVEVFEFIRSSPGVYLFDEFDALAAQRAHEDHQAASREISRGVSTILEMLERTPVNGLIVAATNYDKSLDYALFRRFDDVIDMPLPTMEESIDLIERLLRKHVRTQSPESIQTIARSCSVGSLSLSHAEVERAVIDVIKDSVLFGLAPTAHAIERSLQRRVAMRRQNERSEVAVPAERKGGMA